MVNRACLSTRAKGGLDDRFERAWKDRHISVRFDDRLQTVLRQPSADRHDAAVRWRQLVDLIARSGPGSDSAVFADAIAAIRADSTRVDEELRAAAARAIAALPLPLPLLECFVADRLAVSAPILAAASLEPEQWRALLEQADEETRGFVCTLHPQLAEPSENRVPEARAAPPAAALGDAEMLRDMVRKIERRRRPRGPAPTAEPVQEMADGPERASLFRWECGPSGDIGWVDGAPRGALIGRSIARANDDNGDRFEASGVRAFARRAPFRDATLVLGGSGPVAGAWKVSAVPAFDPVDGRFAGYRGVALREEVAAAAPKTGVDPGGAPLVDSDSLRELVHEIKTPLNAIIGFAEIIDGQYLGPAGTKYRDRATEIAGQARMLLTAIDDLDFAAKLHSGGQANNGAVDLVELTGVVGARLTPGAAAAGVTLDLPESAPINAAVDAEFASRIVERLVAAAIGQAESGETLDVLFQQRSGKASVSIALPAALKSKTERQLFAAPAIEKGDLSSLFSLRLARGLARIARASLALSSGRLKLSFDSA